ncbi:MAG: hypothetical protein K2L95_03510 [Alphaproteobacteria bacterium]|nr:hypothetical protein [Alphaproteobacteria bacterium]
MTQKKNLKKNSKQAVKNVRAKAKPVAASARTANSAPRFSPWSLSIYLYWFIILFFIAATFYILGRSHGVLHPTVNNVEVTEEALLQPNDYYESGKTKLMAGNIDDAIVDLTAAVQAENPSVDALILRGEAYMQSSAYREALADFDAALEMDSMNTVAYYDRALLHMRLEDYAAALNDINNALAARAVKPNDAVQLRDLYAKRGQLNLWMKNWDGAVADYTNSLARPEGVVNPSVYAERAEAYTAMGQYADAINDYTSAVRIISEQIQGATTTAQREDLSNRAMSYFEKSAALNLSLGNVDSARVDLQSAFAIAAALNDAETTTRLQALIAELGE